MMIDAWREFEINEYKPEDFENERASAVYEKHGFRVTERGIIPDEKTARCQNALGAGKAGIIKI